MAIAKPDGETFHPTLILVGTRLGIDKINQVYWESLTATLQLPQSVGIAGYAATSCNRKSMPSLISIFDAAAARHSHTTSSGRSRLATIPSQGPTFSTSIHTSPGLPCPSTRMLKSTQRRTSTRAIHDDSVDCMCARWIPAC